MTDKELTDKEHMVGSHDAEPQSPPEAGQEGPQEELDTPRDGQVGFGGLLRSRWFLSAVGAACLLCLALVGFWAAAPSVPVSPATGGSVASGDVPQDRTPERAHEAERAYEEAFGGPLEEAIKRVDYALVQSMGRTGVVPDALEIRDVEVRALLGQNYHVQTLSIDLNGSADPFVRDLDANLSRWAANATLDAREDGSWAVSVFGRTTHRLYLHEVAPKPAPDGGAPLLTIVIDDLGESVSFAHKLAVLSYPVTFSVWPRSTHALEVQELAARAGREVLVHQPMEPMGYPKVRPGPGAVFTNMDEQAIRDMVARNLARVPHAVGMNNHMGSRFTQDARGVDAVLGVLRENNLFVLDSLTHPGSVVGAEAQRLGVPWLRRDVFPDVVRDVNAVLHQLRKAERIARTTGRAIAIGHPLPETLAALQQWQPGVSTGVAMQVVSLAQMGGWRTGAAASREGATAQRRVVPRSAAP